MSHITHSSKQEARTRHVRKDLDPSRGAVFGKVVSGKCSWITLICSDLQSTDTAQKDESFIISGERFPP